VHLGDRHQLGQRPLEAPYQLTPFDGGKRGDLGVG
jgi:hypothetical protein